MTLQPSGQISIEDINVELGRAASAAFSLNGADERRLAGLNAKSGSYGFDDFYDKSDDVCLVDVVSSPFGSAHSIANVNFGATFTNRRIVIIPFTLGRPAATNPASTGMTLVNLVIGGVSAANLNTVWKSGAVGSTDEFVGVGIRSVVQDSTTSGTISFDTLFNTEVHMAVLSTRNNGTSGTAYASQGFGSSASGSITAYANGFSTQFLACVNSEDPTFTNGVKHYQDNTITVGNSDYTIALAYEAEQSAGAYTTAFSLGASQHYAFGAIPYQV